MTTATIDEVRTGRGDDRPWAVETHGLTKRFKDKVAVDGVELLVPRGCAFGYLGPNGAGKTTLIRVLLGLTHADSGTMSLLEPPRWTKEIPARTATTIQNQCRSTVVPSHPSRMPASMGRRTRR
jgi:ABC-2 type transport system ATP-binding protein